MLWPVLYVVLRVANGPHKSDFGAAIDAVDASL